MPSLFTDKPVTEADHKGSAVAEVLKAIQTQDARPGRFFPPAPGPIAGKVASPDDGILSNMNGAGLGSAPTVPVFSDRFLVGTSTVGDVVDVPTPAGMGRSSVGSK